MTYTTNDLKQGKLCIDCDSKQEVAILVHLLGGLPLAYEENTALLMIVKDNQLVHLPYTQSQFSDDFKTVTFEEFMSSESVKADYEKSKENLSSVDLFLKGLNTLKIKHVEDLEDLIIKYGLLLSDELFTDDDEVYVFNNTIYGVM